MRPLVGSSITFHTRGDNKNARTAVHVVVLARSNTSATADQHSDFVSRLLDERRYEPGGDLPGEEATPYLAFGLGLGADEGVYQGRPFPTVAPPTAPSLSFAAVDHLGPFAKRIPVPYVQRKCDEFVNGRVGPITGENPRLPNIALDSSVDFAEDITPGSYADLQSLVPTAGAPAYVSAPPSLGQLDYGYYLHGIDGASLAPPSTPARRRPR